jgi:thiosulfate/3-mercaptopyruvate sulfurtransferase
MRCLPFALIVLLVSPALAQTPRGDLLVSTADLAKALGQPGVVVLHVTDRESTFGDGHIPGARFLRYRDFAIEGDRGLGSELPSADELKRVFEAAGVSDSSRVIIYGNSTVAAARAFFTLDAAGHTNIALLDGGLQAWKAEKRPLENGPSKSTTRGTFTPKINAAKVADAAFIQQQASKIALVDVRPDPEYLGTDGGMGGMHSPGHITGAQQLPWTMLVGPDGRFLPRPELEAKLRGAGVTTGKPVVAYCMVGMRASVVYFVARYLGHDTRLYDGSIIDWSQRKLPTKTGRDRTQN